MQQRILIAISAITTAIAITIAAIAIPQMASAGITGSVGNGPMVIESGTYTPTYVSAGSANITSVTFPSTAKWSRVGDAITVTGIATVTTTASSTNTEFDFTLPSTAGYAPATANQYDILGTANVVESGSSTLQASTVYADTTQKKPEIRFPTTTAGSTTVEWNIQYQSK